MVLCLCNSNDQIILLLNTNQQPLCRSYDTATDFFWKDKSCGPVTSYLLLLFVQHLTLHLNSYSEANKVFLHTYKAYFILEERHEGRFRGTFLLFLNRRRWLRLCSSLQGASFGWVHLLFNKIAEENTNTISHLWTGFMTINEVKEDMGGRGIIQGQSRTGPRK